MKKVMTYDISDLSEQSGSLNYSQMTEVER